MTVKNYFPGATVTTVTVRYTPVITFADGQSVEMRPHTRANLASLLRSLKGYEGDARVTWTRQEIVRQQEACPWCGARPLVFEMDCDGLASTGTCGSEQCDQLRRCEGCGKDDAAHITSCRGSLCRDCDTVAYTTGRVAASDRYALIPA